MPLFPRVKGEQQAKLHPRQNTMNRIGHRTSLLLLRALTLLVTLLLAQPALPFSVEGEAVVSHQEGSAVATRDRALSEALHSAVTNAAERLRPSLSPSALENLIGEDYLPYVKSYRIVYELSTEALYRLIVEAEIDHLRLEKRLMRVQTQPPALAINPSVSVAVAQGDEGESGLPLDELGREIASLLADRGFRIEEVQGGGGERTGVDIKLSALIDIKTRRSGVSTGRGLYHSLVVLTLTATDRNGVKLAESRKSTYALGGKGAKPGLVKLRGLARASTLEIAVQLEKRTPAPVAGSQTLLLAFNGIRSYFQFEKLDSMLSKSLLGVESIKNRTLSTGRLTFEVSLNIDPREFARMLDGLELGRHSLRLEGVYPDRIEYRLTPKELSPTPRGVP